jgi:aspartate/methionine/tyrosine aminotransferase
MVESNFQAIELNSKIQKNNNSVYDMLSARGKAIYFPKKGILAQTADAKDKDINATIGIALEDDLTPMRLKPIAKLIKKISPEDIFSYASSFGRKELRDVWRKMIYGKNPSLKSEISIPVATSGVTHALSMAGFLFVSPKDKIILPDLYWENYSLIFENTYGGELDKFNTFSKGKFDLESFKEKMIAQGVGKKIVLLNFPNNPSGYTPSEEEVDMIASIIKESAEKGNDIIIIIDDAYFGLVYEDNIFKESLFAKLANIDKKVLAVKVDGPTKEDYVWGFRIGFVTFGVKDGNEDIYAALENKLAGAIRATISNASNLSQSLLLKGFSYRRYDKEKQKKFYILKERYETVKDVIKDPKYYEFFEPMPFNSGYFMCVKLKYDLDSEKIRQILLERYSTGVIVIGDVIRIAFSSLTKKQIRVLFSNLYEACSEIRNKDA